MKNLQRGFVKFPVVVTIIAILIFGGGIYLYAHNNQKNKSTAVGSNSGIPLLNSITPSSGPTGTQINLTGAGLASQDIQILINGKYGIGGSPTQSANNTSLSFNLPGTMYPIPGCENSTHPGTCDALPMPIEPGQYSISVKNSNGTSNSLLYTVPPYKTTAPNDKALQ